MNNKSTAVNPGRNGKCGRKNAPEMKFRSANRSAAQRAAARAVDTRGNAEDAVIARMAAVPTVPEMIEELEEQIDAMDWAGHPYDMEAAQLLSVKRIRAAIGVLERLDNNGNGAARKGGATC